MSLETVQKEVTELQRIVSELKNSIVTLELSGGNADTLIEAHTLAVERNTDLLEQSTQRIAALEQHVSRVSDAAPTAAGSLDIEQQIALKQVGAMVGMYYSNDAELKAIAENMRAQNA